MNGKIMQPDSRLVRDALEPLINGKSLSTTEMQSVMLDIMQGHANDAQISAFLVALRMKGETVSELEGSVRAMRDLMKRVPLSNLDRTVDIVGTGGTSHGADLVNISTASAIVASAAGARVAKHGNRSASSKSGSADVLEAAGVSLELDSKQIARCIETIGIGFMFAPQHHPAMRHAIGVRRALGIRTIFNLLGPMTNPTGLTHHLIGAYSLDWCRPMAEVLEQLGSQCALVVHSLDGLDELSIAAPNQVVSLKDGQITEYQLCAEDVGLKTQSIDSLSIVDAKDSLRLIRDTFDKQTTAASIVAAQMIAFNAGAALHIAGVTSNIKQGVELALDVIDSGQALEKLSILSEFTHTLKQLH
jgi:anthranilate phosphoribosyltransferase